MTYRRTWFSCVLWFLYTVLCIILIGVVGKILLSASVGTLTPQIIYGVLVIPVAVLYWIIRGISMRIRKRWVWNERAVRISTCVAFVLIMAFAAIIRTICLNYYVSYMENYGSDFVNIGQMNLGYYDMAVLAEQGSASPMDYGITYLYVMLLSCVLTFLGHKVVSAVFLQICLQMMGILLAYIVTRKMTGRLPACISILYLAGSLTSLGMLFRIGPEWLFFILYMICMLIEVSFVKNYCEDNIPRLWAITCAIALGALIGAITYLDLIGASLLIVMLIAAVGKKLELETTVYYNYSKGMNAAVIVCACISCAAVWFGIMSLVSYVKGTNVVNDILSRLQMCYLNSFFYTVKPYPGAEYYPDIYWIAALIVPASFLVLEYFRSGKEQNYMLWILLCLLAAPTPMAMFGEHGFRGPALYVWAVLAGLGLQNCIFGGRAKVMQAVIERINTEAEIAPIASQAGVSSGTNATSNTQQTAKTQSSGIPETQAPKPRFIENPLPLPKKHVAREMDYQYIVAEKDMQYDIVVCDNDDFDIQ